MNGSMDTSSIVVFAILAVFVIWKLRSVLGTRTGTERPPVNPFARRNPADPTTGPAQTTLDRGNVIPLPGAAERTPVSAADEQDRWQGFAEPGSALAAGLDQISQADPSFAPRPFLDGAQAAYETIILAFARGDRATLEPLLAKDVFEGFSSAVTAREARGETVETTFVGTDKATMEDAQLRGKTEQIVVRFNTKLITITRDKDGAVVDGSPDRVSDVIDLWTFARDITARDPNWKLVATESGQ